MRNRKYRRRMHPTPEQVAELTQEAVSDLKELMGRSEMTVYGLSLESGIGYETVRRILKGKPAMWWTVEWLKQTLR